MVLILQILAIIGGIITIIGSLIAIANVNIGSSIVIIGAIIGLVNVPSLLGGIFLKQEKDEYSQELKNSIPVYNSSEEDDENINLRKKKKKEEELERIKSGNPLYYGS